MIQIEGLGTVFARAYYTKDTLRKNIISINNLVYSHDKIYLKFPTLASIRFDITKGMMGLCPESEDRTICFFLLNV